MKLVVRLVPRIVTIFLLVALAGCASIDPAPLPPPDPVKTEITEAEIDPEKKMFPPDDAGKIWTAPDKPLPRIYPARWYNDHQAACSITFDDGTLDQYLVAAPELEIRGLRGTFFIITALMEEAVWQDGAVKRELFSWDQARELAWNGHEIASHTASHADLSARPYQARQEIETAYQDIKREIPWVSRFSFSWPYWRSSAEVEQKAALFHHAGRAGGVNAPVGSAYYGGVNGRSPQNFMRIGAMGILTSHQEDDLQPVLDEIYATGGWLIPNFHGIDNGIIHREALGWQALDLEIFQKILDTLISYDFWCAPFGDVARYIRQRDTLNLYQIKTGSNPAPKPYHLQIAYKGPLDSAVYNHHLTMVLDLPLTKRPVLVKEAVSGLLLPFTKAAPLKTSTPPLHGDIAEKAINRYLIDIPPGNGKLLIYLSQD